MGRITIIFIAIVAWRISSIVYAGPMMHESNPMQKPLEHEVPPEYNDTAQIRSKRNPAVAMLLAIKDNKHKNRIHALKFDVSDEVENSSEEVNREIGRSLLESLLKNGELERISPSPKPEHNLIDPKYDELFKIFSKFMDSIHDSDKVVTLKEPGVYHTSNPKKDDEKMKDVDVPDVDVSGSDSDEEFEEVDVEENDDTTNESGDEPISFEYEDESESIEDVEIEEVLSIPMDNENKEVDIPKINGDHSVEDSEESLMESSEEITQKLKDKKNSIDKKKRLFGMSYIQDQLNKMLGVKCDCQEDDFDLTVEETQISEKADHDWFPAETSEVQSFSRKVTRQVPNNLKQVKSKESNKTKVKQLKKRPKNRKIKKVKNFKLSKDQTIDIEKTKEVQSIEDKPQIKKKKLKKSIRSSSFEALLKEKGISAFDAILPIPIVPKRSSSKNSKTSKKVSKTLKNSIKERRAEQPDDLMIFRDSRSKNARSSNGQSNKHSKRSYGNRRAGTYTTGNSEISSNRRDSRPNERHEEESFSRQSASWSFGDNYKTQSNLEEKALFSNLAQVFGIDVSKMSDHSIEKLFKLYKKYSHLLDSYNDTNKVNGVVQSSTDRLQFIPDEEEIREILSEVNIDFDELLEELNQKLLWNSKTSNSNGKYLDDEQLTKKAKPTILKLLTTSHD